MKNNSVARIWPIRSSTNLRKGPVWTHTQSHPVMPTFLSIVLYLFGLFLIHLLLGVRRVARNAGSVWLWLRNIQLVNRDFCSNLHSVFFLLNPLSAVGFLMAQVVGQIPYLLLGATWALNMKHEGTGAWSTVQGKLFETHTTVFAMAGQDAFAMVGFLASFTGDWNSKQYNLQISALPVPNCVIHIADAAAIKVRLICVCRIRLGVYFTLLRRKLQRIVPRFPNPYFDMK